MAAASSTYGDDRSYLECPICLEEVRDPVVLQCGHTQCAKCVGKPLFGTVRCPICRAPTTVPSTGLPINYMLKDVIEKSKEEKPDTFSCIECAERFPFGQFWTCTTCNAEYICSSCGLKNHRNEEKHKLQMMTDVLKARQDGLAAVVQSDKERLVLGRLNNNMAQGLEKYRRRRKRRLIVDDSKTISSEEMCAQITDYSDTITRSIMAPPTKTLMRLKETGRVDRLLIAPALDLASKSLLQAYLANLAYRTRLDGAENADLGLALDEIRSIREGGGTPQRPVNLHAHSTGFGGIERLSAASVLR